MTGFRAALGLTNLSGGDGSDTGVLCVIDCRRYRASSFFQSPLGGGDAEGDTFRMTILYGDESSDIEHVYGSDHADILAGDART